jgi:hypothetical protein
VFNAGLLGPAILLLTVVALTLIFADKVWSASVDLAHHYALVARLMEHGHAAFAFDPSLGEMNSYPRLSHQLAAAAGRITGSPLAGMQTVAVASLMLLWAAFASLLGSLPQRMALAAAFAWTALLAINHYLLHMPLHGDELIGNFFYAQLAGQALCLCGVLFAFHLERRGAPFWLRCALLAPGAWLLTGVHLLPALVLLLTGGLALATELLALWRAKRGRLAAATAVAAVTCLAAVAAVLSHPAFRAMSEISTQNGGMVLPYLDNTKTLLCFSAAMAAVSAAQMVFWARRRHDERLMAVKYIGAYGLAVSGLCLLQGVALVFGFGSEYAMRKYAFALDTAALTALSLIPAMLVYRRECVKETRLLAVLPAFLTVAAVGAVAAPPAVFDMRKLEALERGVMGLSGQATAAPGKFSYVIEATDGTALTEYMMSIAHLHIPRMENANAASLLFQRSLVDWPAVGAVLTAQGSAFDHAPECRRGPPFGGMVALDGTCLLKRAADTDRIAFTQANKVFPCTLQGFSAREANGTWTEGRQASLRCSLAARDKAAGRVEIAASAFHGRQRAILTVQGQPPQEFVFGASTQTISLAAGASAPGEIVMQLALPDAVSPQQLGLSTDSRVLGLFVQALEYK